MTMPEHFEDSPAYGHYPGEHLKVNYAEGIYVGYRYFETKKVEPQFPFGFGLSYTSFELTGLEVRSSHVDSKEPAVTVTVKNSGSRAGAEVVELYLHDSAAKIDRPERELKGFRRVELKPGESKQVEFWLSRQDLSYWSPEKKSWVADAGMFEVEIGASSHDILLRAPLEVK
jgi:beta-glucosidase